MQRQLSIKEIHRAKLRLLRNQIVEDMQETHRKAEALRKAEQMELQWELVKLGVRPLKTRR